MMTRRWIHRGRGPLALTLTAVTLGAAITALQARPRHKTVVEACAPDLASCPDRGCAEAGSPEAAANEIKKTWPNSKRPAVLTFADLEGLQD